MMPAFSGCVGAHPRLAGVARAEIHRASAHRRSADSGKLSRQRSIVRQRFGAGAKRVAGSAWITTRSDRMAVGSQRTELTSLSRIWRRIGAIVALAIIVLVASRIQRARATSATGTAGSASGLSAAASDLAALTLMRIVHGDSFTDQRYTIEALQQLSIVLDFVMKRDGIAQELRTIPDTLREAALRLQRIENASEFSPVVRRAFGETAAAISALQQQRYPHLKRIVSQLQSLALKIQPDRELAAQRWDVDEFFELASDALTAMAQAPS